MYIDTTFPPPDGRLAQLMRLVADFERDDIEAAVDGFIAMLDARDGDADDEDSELAAIVMKSPGVDYDPVTDFVRPDGLAGDPQDSEDDDPNGVNGDEVDASFPEWWEGSGGVTLFVHGNDSALGLEDAEDSDNDRCAAGDDHMIAGPVADIGQWEQYCQFGGQETGCEDDAEAKRPPAWQLDQTAPLFVTAANDWPELAA